MFVDGAFRGTCLGLGGADNDTEGRCDQGRGGSSGGMGFVVELSIETLGAVDVGLPGKDHLGMFGGEGPSGGGRSGLKDHGVALAGGCDAEWPLDLVKLAIVVGDVNSKTSSYLAEMDTLRWGR